MATFNSPQFTAQTGISPARLAECNVSSGEVEFAVIPYTLLGTEAANDIINLAILPRDVIPVPQLSSITCSADPGTTLTAHVGTAADVDGWCAGAVLSAGGQVAATSAGIPAWLAPTPIVPDTGSGNAAVFATVASANTLTAGVKLYFTLAYKRAR